jgi:hypothetical protein
MGMDFGFHIFMILFIYFVLLILFVLIGSCGLNIFSNYAIICKKYNHSCKFNQNNEYDVCDNTIIDVEVNTEIKSIFFIINRRVCPFYISNIYSCSFPLVFGISGLFTSSVVEVLYVYQLFRSSISINRFFFWFVLFFFFFFL